MISEYKLIEFLNKYHKPTIQLKRDSYSNNYKKYKFNDKDGINEFNLIYKEILKYNLNKTILTKGGRVSNISRNRPNNSRSYYYNKTSNGISLNVILGEYVWSFSLGITKNKEDKQMIPRLAFNTFKDICMSNGINLDDYAIDNGVEIKKTIEKPLIKMFYHMNENDNGLTNVHHIDFHSSYPAGLCNTHPEFKKVIEPLYNERKDNPTNKAMLNYTIGCMQSTKAPYYSKWAQLSKDAIHDNNDRVKEMSIRLTLSGRKILGYNTDGIWYQGEIYHGKGEGNKLGQWSNDHINCTFRSKNDGAYEFIENGKYNVVMRGITTYDKINPNRDDWQWGDIYKYADLLVLTFDESEGVKEYEV